MAGISVSSEAVNKLVQACDELVDHLRKISGDVDALASASDSGGWGTSPDGQKIRQKLHEYTTSGCNADGLKKSAEEQIKTIESYKSLLKGGVEKLSAHDEESGKSIEKTVDGDSATKAQSEEKGVNPNGKGQSAAQGGGSSGSAGGGMQGAQQAMQAGMQGAQQAAQAGMQGAQQAAQAGMQGAQQAAQAGMQGAQQAMQAGMQGLGGEHSGGHGEHSGGHGEPGGKDEAHGGHGDKDQNDGSDSAAVESQAGDVAEDLHEDGPQHDGPARHDGPAPHEGPAPRGGQPSHGGPPPLAGLAPGGLVPQGTAPLSASAISATGHAGPPVPVEMLAAERSTFSAGTSAGGSQRDGSLMGQDFQAQTENPRGNQNPAAHSSEDQGGRK